MNQSLHKSVGLEFTEMQNDADLRILWLRVQYAKALRWSNTALLFLKLLLMMLELLINDCLRLLIGCQHQISLRLLLKKSFNLFDILLWYICKSNVLIYVTGKSEKCFLCNFQSWTFGKKLHLKFKKDAQQDKYQMKRKLLDWNMEDACSNDE